MWGVTKVLVMRCVSHAYRRDSCQVRMCARHSMRLRVMMISPAWGHGITLHLSILVSTKHGEVRSSPHGQNAWTVQLLLNRDGNLMLSSST